MNEITLSNNLSQIELEISHHKQIAGQSIWEIGRRLNHVKENDLTHGEFMEWLNKINLKRSEANRMMKVAKELPNYPTLGNLGTTALHLIASNELKTAKLRQYESYRKLRRNYSSVNKQISFYEMRTRKSSLPRSKLRKPSRKSSQTITRPHRT